MEINTKIQELEQLRKQYKITRSLCARLLNIPETTFYRWASGRHNPSPYYLKQIERLITAIQEIKAIKEGEK